MHMFRNSLTTASTAMIRQTSITGVWDIIAEPHGRDRAGHVIHGYIEIKRHGERVLRFPPSILIRQNFLHDGERRAWDTLPEYVKAEAVRVSDRSCAVIRLGEF